MKKIKNLIKNFCDYINGEYAYKKYLEHCKLSHDNISNLSKKQFLNNKRNNKWKSVNRCC